MKPKQDGVLFPAGRSSERTSRDLMRPLVSKNVLHLVPILATCLAVSVACAPESSSQLATPTRVSQEGALCKPDVLPRVLGEQLKSEFASWRILEASDLNRHVAQRWNAEKPLRSPGLAVGQFDGTTEPSYAILLVSKASPKTSYKVLIFTQKPSQTSYESQVLDQSDDGGADSQFIRSVEIKAFFDEDSKKKFKVNAREALLVVFASEREYQADVFFRTDKRYQREPVDY